MTPAHLLSRRANGARLSGGAQSSFGALRSVLTTGTDDAGLALQTWGW